MAEDPVVLDGYDGLAAAVGRELGVSTWIMVDQRRIDGFAECTGDHAWIHVNTERAAKGPFGGTIAHGPLSLSLVTILAGRTFRVGGLELRVALWLRLGALHPAGTLGVGRSGTSPARPSRGRLGRDEGVLPRRSRTKRRERRVRCRFDLLLVFESARSVNMAT